MAFGASSLWMISIEGSFRKRASIIARLMSNYLGNASLSTAVKERVLSTFQQAVTLYKQGRTDEVVQGCGLILRMDPMFDPAKKLLEKTRNPSSPIDVDMLIPPAVDDSRLHEARTAMAGRDFQRVLEITTEMLTEDLTNDEARILNEQAREKTEAAPFAEQFIRKAESLIAQGNSAAARQELEKARALDDDHPGIRRVEQSMNASPMAASSSFIVEPPAGAPARKATQATDFGFTFEEEKQQQQQQAAPRSPFSTDSGAMPPVIPPAGFSFDSPAAPAPPAPPTRPAANDAPFSGFSFDTPSSTVAPFGSFSFDTPAGAPAPPPPANAAGPAQEFDFSTADIVTSPDDQKKIEQYLADGDRAFDSGDFQQAIDLWSRIFLIDVTNDEASHRIEKAKARRREIDGKVESVLSAGVHAFDRKDKDAARAKFNEVLTLDPANVSAQDYLERLNDTVTEGGAGGYEMPFVEPPSSPRPDIFDDDLGMYDAPSAPDPDIPSPKAKAVPAPAPPKAPKKRGGSMGVVVTIVAVVVLVGAGWYGWQKFKPAPAVETAASQTVLTQAASLGSRGQYDRAIVMLQNVAADDPQHDRALQMIADLQQKKAQASEMVGGRPAAEVYQEGLASGRTAFEAHDYEAAKKAFDAAARIKPLPPDMQALYDQATQQAAKLDGARALFKEQKFQDAIISLEQLAQSDPENASIKRMITDAHFNLGAQALQNERLPEAMKEFDEVLKRDPNDELARRSRTLAERYNGQPKDLMFQIYARYLPLRG
jgi:tetratricopeptide (TPR) repeat protein